MRKPRNRCEPRLRKRMPAGGDWLRISPTSGTSDAAVQAAALNVRMNLVSIKDDAYVTEKWSRMQAMQAEAGALKEKVMAITYHKIG